MLAIVGVVIPLGDILTVVRRSPQLFVVYCLAVLGLAVWTAVLALGDLAFVDTLHLTESGYSALNALLEPLIVTTRTKVREA